MSKASDTNFIPDLPKGGPLSEYRKRANFDWKALKLIFADEQYLRTEYRLWKILEDNTLFARPKNLDTNEAKRLTALQMNYMAKINNELYEDDENDVSINQRHKYLSAINEALHAYSPSLSVKLALCVGLFNNSIIALGTERHEKFYKAAWNREIVTCLAITEVAHGSNTKRIRTRATYDPQTKEFVIHTPDFEAAKAWVGNLGKTATIALTFANLYTPDGESHGLHAFIIPIRDPKTLTAYPGVLVGDLGEKIGLNGIDNGFMMFNNYRIPRENLLNRTGDVDEEGVFESVFNEPSKVLGAALESFSAGRVGIMQESVNTLAKATVIAVRYAAVRKQFGPDRDGEEVPIIEYPLHQWRIFPYLAAACVLRISTFTLFEVYLSTIEKSQKDSNEFELLTHLVSELHALISSSKPLITWTARDAIQEAREACGGHGYLKASRIGDLRNDHDASCTYEGDNNVLGQQASNWLIRQWNNLESPMGSVSFLKKRDEVLSRTFNTVRKTTSIVHMDFALQCYEWLICYLIKKTSGLMEESKSRNKNSFEARNGAQVFAARDLSRAYPEYYALRMFKERYSKPDVSDEIRSALHKSYLIYACWSLDKHMTTFYEGGFASGSHFANCVRKTLLDYCSLFKDVAVTVADALAPPDFVLDSVIAKADGLLYENLQNEFMTNEGALERPKWWKDVIIQKSKL